MSSLANVEERTEKDVGAVNNITRCVSKRFGKKGAVGEVEVSASA